MGKPWADTISGEELRQVQRGIDQTLRQTVAHKPYSPGEMPSSGTVTVVGAPTVVGGERGWVDSRPLGPPLTGHAERVGDGRSSFPSGTSGEAGTDKGAVASALASATGGVTGGVRGKGGRSAS